MSFRGIYQTVQQNALAQSSLPQSIYHLADAANWLSIQRHGLLSTSALLDLAGIEGRQRERIEQRHRADQVILATGVIIRDQKPMPPAALERCLQGMTPCEWYALLNARVFFWLDSERLNRMVKANQARPQLLLTVDTEQLLAAYTEQVALTPFNTGNARRRPAVRGRQTFVPYGTWIESRWASEAEALEVQTRPKSHRPAEFVITHAVPNILNFVKETRLLTQGEFFPDVIRV